MRADADRKTHLMADSLETHHPFLIRDAPALGIRPSDLRSPRYRRIFRGVGVHSEVPDTVVVRSRAALLLAPRGLPASARVFGAMVLVGVLANALVCGGISQPATRYGARVAWLLPLTAVLLLLIRLQLRLERRRPG